MTFASFFDLTTRKSVADTADIVLESLVGFEHVTVAEIRTPRPVSTAGIGRGRPEEGFRHIREI